MKQVKFWLCFFAFTLLLSGQIKAQQIPFYDEIQSFKKQDSSHFPPANSILFIGSSSFRMWKSVQQDFPGKPIINRGFGGSSTPDVIRYANDIIFPYNPKQIIIYVGENDLASTPAASPKEVTRRVKELVNLIQLRLPEIPIVYISIKPSIARQNLMPAMEKANKKIKKFISRKKNARFVDVYTKMLDVNGLPLSDIFIQDNLHMNAKGYAIWKKILEPYLE